MKRIFVLAKNASEVAEFIRSHGLGPQHVAYISSEHSVRGVCNPAFVVLEGFWERADAKQIWMNLQVGMIKIKQTWPKEMIVQVPAAAPKPPKPQTTQVPLPPPRTPVVPVKDDEEEPLVIPKRAKKRDQHKKTFKKIHEPLEIPDTQ